MKKANAILEYGILITIVVSALMGINKFLERNSKGYIKTATDHVLKRPIPFLWQGSLNVNIQNATTERRETLDGEIEDTAAVDISYTAIQAPTPPYIDVASLHAQDAPPSGGENKQPRNPLARRERGNPQPRLAR